MMMVSPRDTIAHNDSVLEVFQHSRAYDYERELAPEHADNYFGSFWDYITDLLDMPNPFNDLPDGLWWCMGALVLAGVAYLVWKHWDGLFGPRDVKLHAEEITEADINEVDLDQLIAAAEKDNDYLMLCRLRYLKVLKAASDAALVNWRRYKTPTQYAMEWLDKDFGIMTNHFLRIRYGHYTADAALATEMRSRQETLQARIADNAGNQEPNNRQEEGGVQS